MISRRTTARGTLVLALVLLALAGGARAAAPQKIVFPVLGTATYSDDFGDPRADGPPHQGIDIMATKRSLALAAEAGKVEFWTHSATDCAHTRTASNVYSSAMRARQPSVPNTMFTWSLRGRVPLPSPPPSPALASIRAYP